MKNSDLILLMAAGAGLYLLLGRSVAPALPVRAATSPIYPYHALEPVDPIIPAAIQAGGTIISDLIRVFQ